jgi:replicative DNA helicase
MTPKPPDDTFAIETRLAERSVLGAMIEDPAAVADARAELSAESFYYVGHQRLFTAIVALEERGIRAELLAVAAELRRLGHMESLGGIHGLGQIINDRVYGGTVRQRARQVREAHSRREARAMGLTLARSIEAGGALEPILRDARLAIERVHRLDVAEHPPTLADQLMNDEQLFSAELTVAPDLIRGWPSATSEAHPFIVEGGMTLLVGQSGLGKTWLGLQMLRAVALGRPFLGRETRQARGLLLELEMSAASIRDRLREPMNGMLDCLIMPAGFSRLTDPDIAHQVEDIIRSREIKLMVADPLHGLHDGDENISQEVAPFMETCAALRSATGVHIVVLHHVNKLELDKNSGLRSSVLRSVRGSGRLVNDPDNVIGLLERPGGLRLVFAKTRLGPSPESIGIRREANSGWFEVADLPEEHADKTREKVEKALNFTSDRSGGTAEDIARLAKVSERTARRYLEELGAVGLKDGKRIVYWRAGIANEQESLPDF